jgi:hypothetical protein
MFFQGSVYFENVVYFVRSVSFGLRRAFEKNQGLPEEDFEIRVAYAGMEPRFRTTSVLSKVPFD